jgi:hypothetical protein
MWISHPHETGEPRMHAESCHASRMLLFPASALLVCAVSLLATQAHAAPCASDSDCPTHFTCITVAQTACGAPATCAPDAGDCLAPSACQAKDVKVCRSAECRRDADCPEDTLCYSDGGRPRCVPQYLVPCARSSDCGASFVCNTQQAGNPRCELQRVSCETAADCPARFSCGADPQIATKVATCDESDAGADDAGAPECASAGNICLPPYAAVDFSVRPPRPTSTNPAPNGEAWGEPYHQHASCSVRAVRASTQPVWLLPALIGGALCVRLARRRRH